jgi:hypothetical protein
LPLEAVQSRRLSPRKQDRDLWDHLRRDAFDVFLKDFLDEAVRINPGK